MVPISSFNIEKKISNIHFSIYKIITTNKQGERLLPNNNAHNDKNFEKKNTQNNNNQMSNRQFQRIIKQTERMDGWLDG